MPGQLRRLCVCIMFSSREENVIRFFNHLSLAVIPLFFSFLVSVGGAHSQPAREGADEAQKAIDACWETSLNLRSLPNDDSIRRGHDLTIDCLEVEIAHRYPTLFKPGFITPEKVVTAFRDHLQVPFLSFYFDMMNHNAGCDPRCGTDKTILFLAPYERYLEDLLREIEYTRAIYHLPKFTSPSAK